MKGFKIDDNELKVLNDLRVVFSTEGSPVNLLPMLYSFTGQVLTFPDPPKDYVYGWRGRDDRGFNPAPDEPDSHAQTNSCRTWFTRTPQEYESSTTLMAAPAGADVFFGMVQFTQTTAPTHTWYGVTLIPMQKTGESIPWYGSGMMEQALGLTRLMHLVVEGGNLVMVAQQSVGPAVGGAVHEWGDYPAGNIFSTAGDNEGGNFVVGTTPGLIVWWSSASPYSKSGSRVINTDGNPADYIDKQRGQGDACSITDPTNYESVYSVDIAGYFGKLRA